jgi:hypothetical protein
MHGQITDEDVNLCARCGCCDAPYDEVVALVCDGCGEVVACMN